MMMFTISVSIIGALLFSLAPHAGAQPSALNYRGYRSNKFLNQLLEDARTAAKNNEAQITSKSRVMTLECGDDRAMEKYFGMVVNSCFYSEVEIEIICDNFVPSFFVRAGPEQAAVHLMKRI